MTRTEQERQQQLETLNRWKLEKESPKSRQRRAAWAESHPTYLPKKTFAQTIRDLWKEFLK